MLHQSFFVSKSPVRERRYNYFFLFWISQLCNFSFLYLPGLIFLIMKQNCLQVGLQFLVTSWTFLCSLLVNNLRIAFLQDFGFCFLVFLQHANEDLLILPPAAEINNHKKIIIHWFSHCARIWLLFFPCLSPLFIPLLLFSLEWSQEGCPTTTSQKELKLFQRHSSSMHPIVWRKLRISWINKGSSVRIGFSYSAKLFHFKGSKY